MATNYNYFGNLVTSGLVLDLDAAKIASYPGTGTTWYDISGNGNNGTLTNGPAFSGISKAANFNFDNTDDYVVISSSATITPRTGDFTSDFWINPTAWTVSNYQPIQVTAITNGLWIGQNASNQFIVRAFGVADRLQYATRPVTGSWSNVSITRNSNLINLYYNGTPVTSSISNQDFVQGTTYLGSDAPGGGGAVYFNGRIASSKYYNRGLSQFEVWQNFNAIKGRYGIPDIVTNGLVLNLDAGNPYSYLSGSSGTKWTNTVAVSSSISGTLVNGPVYANGAISFDGVDDRIGTNYSPTSYNNTTQIVWYKWNGVNQHVILTYLGSSGGNGFGFYLHDGASGVDGNRVGVLYGGSFYNALNTGSLYASLTSSQWCQLTITRNSSTTILYQNGNLIGSTSRTPNTAVSYSFSYGDNIYGAAGNVSNVQFYNRALSAAEITQNFNALRGRYGI
jgi:hypothetical protein